MITPEHERLLSERHAITPQVAEDFGIYSVTTVDQLPTEFAWVGEEGLPGLVFPWVSTSGDKVPQYRPDTPIEVEDEDRPRKYLWPKGSGSVIGVVREDDSDLAIIVEGTKQAIVCAAYTEVGSVYAVAGCRNWSEDGVPNADLSVVEDKRVLVMFDGDVRTNLDVWTAANRLKEALIPEGATSVEFVNVPAAGTAALDDVLARRPEDKRSPYVTRLLKTGKANLGAAPKAKPRRRKTDADGRPVVTVNGDRYTAIETLTAALVNRYDADVLFNFGGLIAQRQGAAMAPVTHGMFPRLVHTAAMCMALNAKGEVVASEPSQQVMSACLHSAEFFSPLEKIAQAPFVREDGTICQTSGYDAQSETYVVLTPELERIDVPEFPTAVQRERALADLHHWLIDFLAIMPTDADKANALGLVLTPFVRGLCGTVPLAVVNGLQMGVGKNMFADILSLLVTGERAAALPWSKEDEENRKVITAAFRSGAKLFVFDEAHKIEGISLSRALTGDTYTDRILGSSTNVELPNNVTWVALGNNVTVNGDTSRRYYTIRLEPQTPNPQDRSADAFTHADVRQYTLDNRVALLEALLTLVRAWFVAGQPQSAAGRRFGSFESWGGMVGGILQVAGVEGFLGNLVETRSESDYERTYWLDHYRWLTRKFGVGTSFTVGSVVRKLLEDGPGTAECPPGLEDPEAKGYNRRLGQAYRHQKNKVLDDLQLIQSRRSDHHGNSWTVVVRDRSLQNPAKEPEKTLKLGDRGIRGVRSNVDSKCARLRTNEPSEPIPVETDTRLLAERTKPNTQHHPYHPDGLSEVLEGLNGREGSRARFRRV